MKKIIFALLLSLSFGQIWAAGEDAQILPNAPLPDAPKTPMEEKIEYIKQHKNVLFVGLGALALAFALGAVCAAPTSDKLGTVHFWGDGSQKKRFVALKGENFFPTLGHILKSTVFPYGTDHPGKIAGAVLTWIVGTVGIIVIGEYIINQNKSFAAKLAKIGATCATAGKEYFFPGEKKDLEVRIPAVIDGEAATQQEVEDVLEVVHAVDAIL